MAMKTCRMSCLIAACLMLQVGPTKVDLSGLKFEWFQGENLETKVNERVDSKVASYFGDGAPGLGCDVDHFSCRWSGFLAAPSSGDYKFCAKADDGFRLFLNNQLVLSGWDYNGAQSILTQKMKLKKGDAVAIQFEYRDREHTAFARLAWWPPGSTGFVTIPSGVFFQTKEAASSANKTADNSTGLEMKVFQDLDFKKLLEKASDANVDHVFWTDQPFQDVPSNRYSIRWHGYFVTPSTDLYQIIAYADDGIRVTVDGNLVIDDLKPCPTSNGKRAAAAPLSLGVHEITAEYVQFDGDAFVSLHWAVDGKYVEHVIPPSVFFRDKEAAAGFLKARDSGERKDSK